MKNVVIIGNGPAGISAALYTKRAGFNTTIIGKDSGALAKSDKVENYYGFEMPISGGTLIETGISQAKRLGVDVIQDEVTGIGYEDKFVVKTSNAAYYADAIILATGAGRTTPKIPGLVQYEGKGVSYCAVCDAFFHRGKNVAVLGCCEYALAEALELLPVAGSVTIVTNGEEPITKIPTDIKVITSKILEIKGEDTLECIHFEDGSTLYVSGLFVAVGVAQSSDLANKLGAQTEGRRIVVDDAMATTIPGLYAAGDCTGGMLQIAKAVYEGAKAGTELIKFLRGAPQRLN